MNIGKTTFTEGVAKDISFQTWEEMFSKTVFKDDDGKIVSKKQAFKLMGGVHKVDKPKKQKEKPEGEY